MNRIYDTLRTLFSKEMFHILVLNFDFFLFKFKQSSPFKGEQ